MKEKYLSPEMDVMSTLNDLLTDDVIRVSNFTDLNDPAGDDQDWI